MSFHSATAGAPAFHRDLRGRRRVREGLGRRAGTREDFRAGAALARPGDRVLDVCGGEVASAALPPEGAPHQRLEPHGAPLASPPVLAETVEAHAARFPGACDLACALRALGHAADPLGTASAMAECLAPGGLLVSAMPIWPSPHTEVLNNFGDLPPQHLTRRDEGACRALGARLGGAAGRALAGLSRQAVRRIGRGACARSARGAAVARQRRPRLRRSAAAGAAAGPAAGREAARHFAAGAGAGLNARTPRDAGIR